MTALFPVGRKNEISELRRLRVDGWLDRFASRTPFLTSSGVCEQERRIMDVRRVAETSVARTKGAA